MKRLVFLLIVLALLVAACGTSEPVTGIPVTVSAAATVSDTLAPSATSTQPPPTATLRPADGTLTIQVNVRAGPGTSYDSLGLLSEGVAVQVFARDAGTKWYQIAYPSGPTGRGWVAAQYVTLAAEAEIPVDATPTPTGPTGRVLIRLNVRSGPGTSFDSLGMLEAETTVALTGKNATASWFRIDYSSDLSSSGWVTAQYIQTDASASLPVLDDYGNVVTPGAQETDSGPALAPTPTIGPAYADSDSPSAPGVRVSFSAVGTRQIVYTSQVSAPEGDLEDWIEFTPYAVSGGQARVSFSLSCSGNATLTVELWQASTLLEGWGSLTCGESGVIVSLPASLPVQVRLTPSAGDELRLVAYALIVRNLP